MYVEAATKDMIAHRINDFITSITEAADTALIEQWDHFKRQLEADIIALKKEARQRTNNGYRQRIGRLKKKINAIQTDTPASSKQRKDWVKALRTNQKQYRALKRRMLQNRNVWTSTTSAKFFFQRLSTKYGDNIIPTLNQKAGAPPRDIHDKTSILTDHWFACLNGIAGSPGEADAFIQKYMERWQKTDVTELDDEITEDEVAAAIAKCKLGKSCGPDNLGNEWYKDYHSLLTPLLTRLYNACMQQGKMPETFSEAYIFSISKGGNTANALNYRPIALLNTGYKILTRILAWRVHKYIRKLVHATQFGLRMIHDAINILEAAKKAAHNNETLSNAQVLLLDFAKAYDSLDRAYLFKILRAKGFPPLFIRAIQAMHQHTSVKFMANGTLSDSMSVISGIRQGCPLALLLFIIAVGPLYDAIEVKRN
ncbi:hypothetical protein PC118_g5662 [Phytophthora cactorum]|uniref:Reverse transcriptase domain-containing protein n=2 Tax=Phytophthora cactorum TaxID=29920 RepID=A0A8T0YM50_9STRA|nr:hypothetical protein PC112_g18649 [Phytophthora cactorum]KAG2805985.1 hypothetical protein PC111_g17574 [Phytophthora cactorum]KAG2843507.1 hypothetical protein PC113_g18586 [Phytophthora cactorum]KAG2894933.1 hypothetical protein PC115_g18018 [Phytophthora cactorum]KAG2990408.1 hypothetical protein PC118_g5662 [Phytophthora cactorum]